LLFLKKARKFKKYLLSILAMPTIIPSKKWELTLGLDLGIASVGWSLISFNWDNPIFLDAWVKIFQEPVEAKTGTPKNQKRRDARWARKNLARKTERKRQIRETLAKHSLKFDGDHWKNPYELRTKWLDEKLTIEEIGIMLYHFSQKRWFLSNRKSGKSNEDGKVYSSITTIQQWMESCGARTLGEYRYKLIQKERESWNSPKKFVEQYTSRSMYQEEFDMIWFKQAQYYPEIFTENLRSEIRNYIFFQRPLKNQKSLVGQCIYYKDRKRAQRASLITQEFLIWKNINDIKYKQKWTYEFLPIPHEKKEALANILMNQKTLSFWKIKKELGLWEDIVFNFENWKRNELKWNSTNSIMSSWDRWNNFSLDEKDKIVTEILTIETTESLQKLLKEKYGMNDLDVSKFSKPDLFEKGYIWLSEKAIKKILPIMKEMGKWDREVTKLLIREWKFPKERNLYTEIDPWKEIPPFRNPIVTKSVIEARKVIKAIIKAYGTPTTIRIEMASDMKKTKKQKDDALKQNNLNKKENDEAKNHLEEQGLSYWYANKLLYKLHKECKGFCPYTGKRISLSQLFSETSEIDIEHIIPYSRCLDDSYMNKTLCYADFNRSKKWNKTPYEMWQSGIISEEEYQNMLARLASIPRPKRLRFEQKEVDTDSFISRQINDTRYVCREVRTFCEALVGIANVEITKWSLTALLRHAWWYSALIHSEWENEKDRSDHRHHSIDATVVALTSRSLLQHASSIWSQNETLWKRWSDTHSKITKVYDEIWPSEEFKKSLWEKLKTMIISHTATHKIRWAIHEETSYGKIYDIETKEEVFVIRKKLTDKFDKKHIEKVVDPVVRGILTRYFETNEKFSIANPPRHKDGKTPILSVRMKEKKTNMYDYRGEGEKFFEYGSNHHVEILEHKIEKNKDGTPKREWVFVTMWEANRRAKKKEAIVNRNWPWKNEIKKKDFDAENWNFAFSLSSNDMVKYYPQFPSQENAQICRVQKLGAVRNEVGITNHLESLPEKCIWVTISKLNIQKIQIDSLGNISVSND
jgi:CRISPR-associated endonuclease Csn1